MPMSNMLKKNIANRETKIRLGSGAGPSSNMFSVKNGKLMLNGNIKNAN